MGGGTARTVAYDKATGEVVWKTGTGPAGYAALTRIRFDTEDAILAFHGKGLAALSPADGATIWEVAWETDHDVNATTPVVTDGQIFITSGYGTGCQLLKVTRDKATPLWTNKAIASHHSDPYILAGHIYGFSGQSTQNRGSFKCLDLATGQEKWATDAMGWGTCVYVDGHILSCDIKGNLVLMKPSPEKYEEVARMPGVFGKVKGAAWTVPVVAAGNLYLRFKNRLLCYGLTLE